MMFHTHLAFGFLSALIALKFISVPNKYLFLVLVPLFALVPDIDMHKSKIGKKAGFLSRTIEFFFGHRGIFHTIYPAIALFILLYYLNYKWVAFAIFIGYFSHLLIDGFTVSGVDFFKPLFKLNLNGFVKTGTILEHIIFLLIIIFDIIYFLKLF